MTVVLLVSWGVLIIVSYKGALMALEKADLL